MQRKKGDREEECGGRRVGVRRRGIGPYYVLIIMMRRGSSEIRAAVEMDWK